MLQNAFYKAVCVKQTNFLNGELSYYAVFDPKRFIANKIKLQKYQLVLIKIPMTLKQLILNEVKNIFFLLLDLNEILKTVYS